MKIGIGEFESTVENDVVNLQNADHQTLARVAATEIATILNRKILAGTPVDNVNCIPRIYIFKQGKFLSSIGISGDFRLANVPSMISQAFDKEGDTAVLGMCVTINNGKETAGMARVYTPPAILVAENIRQSHAMKEAGHRIPT
jgi:hypothetical protein